VQALFELVKERFGGLDLLFNNAGLGISAPFVNSTPGQWTTMIDVNLYGVFNCTHAAIYLMRGRPGAMISFVSSWAAGMACRTGLSTARPSTLS
jgi:NAD(P)-dependent dehydrogenase (short-subunit alcohol dehydrogenase family)